MSYDNKADVLEKPETEASTEPLSDDFAKWENELNTPEKPTPSYVGHGLQAAEEYANNPTGASDEMNEPSQDSGSGGDNSDQDDESGGSGNTPRKPKRFQNQSKRPPTEDKGNKAAKKAMRAEQNAAKQTAKQSGKEGAKQGEKQAIKQGGKQAAKQVGKQAAKQGTKLAAEAATSETVVAPLAIEAADQAQQIARAAAKAAVTLNTKDLEKQLTKWPKRIGWIIAVIFIFIIFFTVVIIGGGADLLRRQEEAAAANPDLKIFLDGPQSAKKDDSLTYTITVAYPKSASDIVLTYILPTGTNYLSASQKVSYNQVGKVITWSAKDNNITFPGSTTFTVTLVATTDNAYLVNIVNGNVSQVATFSCGQQTTPQTPPPLSCSGTNTTPVSHGYYIPTFFGCSGSYKDPNDNCAPACPKLPNVIKGSSTVPVRQTNPEYEIDVEWFAANADEYGCNATLKVTNPSTGRAVVVKAIDKGPSCSVQRSGAKFDLSKAAYDAIGANQVVHIEQVSDTTALGPIPACNP